MSMLTLCWPICAHIHTANEILFRLQTQSQPPQQSQPQDGAAAAAAAVQQQQQQAGPPAEQLAGYLTVLRCDPASEEALTALCDAYEAAPPAGGSHASAAEGAAFSAKLTAH